MNLITSAQTMSSREIAELVGSRHDNVKRSIERIAKTGAIKLPPMEDVKNGRKQAVSVYQVPKRDTYVIVAQLSPEFTAALVDRWQALEVKEAKRLEAAQARSNARLEAPMLTDAIKDSRGDSAKHYHYSNEYNLINRLVLGMTAKQYRKEHGLDSDESIRDSLTAAEIKAVEHLQRLNTSMIELGLEYDERKKKLTKIMLLKHNDALLLELEQEY